MALHGKAKGGGGGEFVPCPAGPQQVVCCDVVDLGLVMSPGWQGAPDSKKHKCRIFWQSVEHEEPNGKPALLMGQFTVSMHEKASLRKLIEQWRGKPFVDDDEAEAFDIEKLIGANGYGNVIHKKTDKGIFANLASIMPCPKSMPKSVVRDYVRVCNRPGYVPPTFVEIEEPARDIHDDMAEDSFTTVDAPDDSEIPF